MYIVSQWHKIVALDCMHSIFKLIVENSSLHRLLHLMKDTLRILMVHLLPD